MYRNTGIEVSSTWVQSEYDGINLRLNYFQPNHEQATNIGLILAHGYSNDRWWMHQFGISAASAGIHTVAMDYRGHGISQGYRTTSSGDNTTEKWQQSSNQAAYDLLSAYNYLMDIGCENIVVGGHSMGGFCSARFAMTFPHLVNATILIGAAYPYIGEDINQSTPPNCLCIIGQDEELFTQSMLEDTIIRLTNNSSATLEELYGDFSDGSARKATILTSKGYFGHVNEPTHTKTIETGLQWINSSVNGIGGAFSYSNEMESQILNNLSNLKLFMKFLYFGLFGFLIPFMFIVSLLLKPNQKSFTMFLKNENQFIEKKYLYLLPYLLEGLIGVLFMGIIKWTNLEIIHLSNVNPFLGFLYGSFIGGVLTLMIFKFKFFSKTSLKSQKTLFLKLLGFGIVGGFLIPILFQIGFVWPKIPNFIGELPVSFKRISIWFFLCINIFIAFTPQLLFIWMQEKHEHQNEILWNFLGLLIYLLILLFSLIFFQYSILSIVFIFAFLLVLQFIQFIGYCFQKNIEFGLLTHIMASIFVSWVIIEFMPFTI